MGRPRIADRAAVASATLTLRLTADDRELLDRLVAARSADLDGADVTAASYVRWLIRREGKRLDAPRRR